MKRAHPLPTKRLVLLLTLCVGHVVTQSNAQVFSETSEWEDFLQEILLNSNHERRQAGEVLGPVDPDSSLNYSAQQDNDRGSNTNEPLISLVVENPSEEYRRLEVRPAHIKSELVLPFDFELVPELEIDDPQLEFGNSPQIEGRPFVEGDHSIAALRKSQGLTLPVSQRIPEQTPRPCKVTYSLTSFNVAARDFQSNNNCSIEVRPALPSICRLSIHFQNFMAPSNDELCSEAGIRFAGGPRSCGNLTGTTEEISFQGGPIIIEILRGESSNNSTSLFDYNMTIRQVDCLSDESPDEAAVLAQNVLGLAQSTTSLRQEITECNRFYNSKEFILQSPNYPNNYPAGRDCVATVFAAEANICSLELRFDEFRMEPSAVSDECANDYLEVSDDNGLRKPVKYCGVFTGIRLVEMDGVKRFKFHSNNRITDVGYSIYVKQVPCDELPPNNGEVPGRTTPSNDEDSTTSRPLFDPPQTDTPSTGRPPFQTSTSLRPPFETSTFTNRPPFQTSTNRPPFQASTNRPPFQTSTLTNRPPYQTSSRPSFSTTINPFFTTPPPFTTNRPSYSSTENPFFTTPNPNPGYFPPILPTNRPPVNQITPTNPNLGPRPTPPSGRPTFCSRTYILDYPLRITSPNYPNLYLDNENCDFRVQITRSDVCFLQVNYLSFSLENSADCYKDYLWLFGNKICGQQSGSVLYPLQGSDQPILKFVSDNFGRDSGFDIELTQIPCQDQTARPPFSTTFRPFQSTPDYLAPFPPVPESPQIIEDSYGAPRGEPIPTPLLPELNIVTGTSHNDLDSAIFESNPPPVFLGPFPIAEQVPGQISSRPQQVLTPTINENSPSTRPIFENLPAGVVFPIARPLYQVPTSDNYGGQPIPTARPPFHSAEEGITSRPPFAPIDATGRPPFIPLQPTARPPFIPEQPTSHPPYIPVQPTARPPFIPDQPTARPPFIPVQPTARPPFAPPTNGGSSYNPPLTDGYGAPEGPILSHPEHPPVYHSRPNYNQRPIHRPNKRKPKLLAPFFGLMNKKRNFLRGVFSKFHKPKFHKQSNKKRPSNGYGVPQGPTIGSGYGAPQGPPIGSGYGAPQGPPIGSGYGAPQGPPIGSGYGAPQGPPIGSGYGAPQGPPIGSGYGAPQGPPIGSGYGAPQGPPIGSGYGAPQSPSFGGDSFDSPPSSGGSHFHPGPVLPTARPPFGDPSPPRTNEENPVLTSYDVPIIPSWGNLAQQAPLGGSSALPFVHCGSTTQEHEFLMQSPGYPRNYHNGDECTFEVIPRPNSCSLRLFMEDFIMEESTNCVEDYLEIGGERLCGQQSGRESVLLRPDDQASWVVGFKTDGRGNCRGFQIRARQVPCQEEIPRPRNSQSVHQHFP